MGGVGGVGGVDLEKVYIKIIKIKFLKNKKVIINIKMLFKTNSPLPPPPFLKLR